MKKLLMLASVVLVITGIIAGPSMAQGPFRPIDGAEIKRGDCGVFDVRFGGVQLSREEVIEIFGEEALEEAFPGRGAGVPFFCVIFDGPFPEPEPEDGQDDDDGRDGRANDDDDGRDGRANDDVVPAFEISQESEQEAESGDIDQSFTVTGGGDNSNQCAGIQGVANTGNAQNQISVLQSGSEADDFSFEDSGASITVSPSNTTTCDQQVNQAASAFGS